MSAALRAALLAVAVIALVPAAGVGTAVAQHRASATVTVTNFGSQPLFLNATYSTIESPGTASGPQMLQPNTSGTYVVTFPRLPGPGQVWLFRWGASNIFVGVSAVFLSGGGQDVQCGYTDANAGYDGERPVPWTSRCDATTQQGTGATTIIGTANVTDPPIPTIRRRRAR